MKVKPNFNFCLLVFLSKIAEQSQFQCRVNSIYFLAWVYIKMPHFFPLWEVHDGGSVMVDFSDVIWWHSVPNISSCRTYSRLSTLLYAFDLSYHRDNLELEVKSHFNITPPPCTTVGIWVSLYTRTLYRFTTQVHKKECVCFIDAISPFFNMFGLKYPRITLKTNVTVCHAIPSLVDFCDY